MINMPESLRVLRKSIADNLFQFIDIGIANYTIGKIWLIDYLRYSGALKRMQESYASGSALYPRVIGF
jgi:hypothetical protein